MTELQRTRTTDDVRHIEAKAAQEYWQQWVGFRLSFKGAGVPAEWRVFLSVHPMQAMLNYSIGVLAGRLTRVVIAKGFDAAFGFLHDGRKPGRLSLVWDAVEVFRPELVRTVFGFAEERAFKRYDFGIFANDGVGLLPPLAKEIAELTKTVTLKDMVKTVDWIAGLIRAA